MSRMTDTELKLWKDRLTFADRFWKESGCTGDSVNRRATITTFGEAYRGNQWPIQGWAGLAQDELLTVNLMFSSTNTLIAGLSARAAKPIIKPKGQSLADDGAARRAQLNEVLLGSYATDLKVKRQMDRAVLKAALFPAGFVRHGYTPREEMFQNGSRILPFDKAIPDFPWIREVGIQSIRVDPMASSLYPDEDARWCCFDDLFLLQEVRENPGFINRSDLKPNYVISQDKTKPLAFSKDGGPDESQLVLVRTVYDRMERKWFCLAPGVSRPIREPEDWPIPWDSLPYDVLFFNESPLSMMPVALPEVYFDLCVELNKARTMMSALVKRMRYAVLANSGALAEGELDKMVDGELQEFFEVNGVDPRTVVAAIKIGEFPQELLLYAQRIMDDIREVIGISNMDRGQRINVTTATEAGDVQQGSNVLRSRSQEKVEELWGNVFRKMHRGIQQTQTDAILLPIFDKAGLSADLSQDLQGSGIRIEPNDLQGEFHYGVQSGSTLPENPQEEVTASMGLFQTFKGDALVNQRMIRHDVLTAFRRDADRLLAISDGELGQNLTDLGHLGVGASLAAPEKPGQMPTAPPMPMPSKGNGAAGAASANAPSIDPALLRELAGSGQGGAGVPQ